LEVLEVEEWHTRNNGICDMGQKSRCCTSKGNFERKTWARNYIMKISRSYLCKRCSYTEANGCLLCNCALTCLYSLWLFPFSPKHWPHINILYNLLFRFAYSFLIRK
jgi:hypothetical protein